MQKNDFGSPFYTTTKINLKQIKDLNIKPKTINRHEFEQALGIGDGQGSLACCSPWGHKELDVTEQLNNVVPDMAEVLAVK